MDLGVNGSVITGTWREQTSASGYYAGGVYSSRAVSLPTVPRVDKRRHAAPPPWAAPRARRG